ncbi:MULTISPECIES: GNAT family N-acetyltransferase [Variovorax]|uniref:GNAT family N-acetyltransferase n=1 Tax=Variovorax TaxID=34072 RepID=UPI00086E3B03|nr:MULTISPECIES: GNAT family N-acetyltransferase [Variovorax]MBN8755033.1 GNAT family N-acetyltransferase [Variovorax sp.]ODU14848.1 MAG: GNAT family N-acetyltransferase [Variovorax sp. SCN 67-85]ODV26182.1 MAG: GNAT family N-acetyltransferase [Variovorax sp. SCN 67-20]OJZ03859.1 MAG: GNAT family N-acetyltransferase [Variovorax sp. 67-131]UKI07393.1 GNAT family N-acetyltransferase [Variovorax paradoxus]
MTPPQSLLKMRKAVQADLPVIVAMLADDVLGAARERPGDTALYEAALRRIEAQDGNQLLVAELPEGVVGCLQLIVIPGLGLQGAVRGQIEGVRVASSQRGQRIGEQMIAFAIDAARAAGCRLVQLTTDKRRTDAHRFYERLGFKATHEGMKLELA